MNCKITKFELENVKRVRLVDITPAAVGWLAWNVGRMVRSK